MTDHVEVVNTRLTGAIKTIQGEMIIACDIKGIAHSIELNQDDVKEAVKALGYVTKEEHQKFVDFVNYVGKYMENMPTPDLYRFGDEWAMRCDHAAVHLMKKAHDMGVIK
jgi:hypothetical protein